MGVKDQNYYNTFIEVADDCLAAAGEIPAQKTSEKSVAVLQYELIGKNPGKYTQEDVLFKVFATRQGIARADHKKAREIFFSKGQPCMRCSPLGKRYGWGIYCDQNGKVSLVSRGTKEYEKLARDKTTKHLKAMRSKRQ